MKLTFIAIILISSSLTGYSQKQFRVADSIASVTSATTIELLHQKLVRNLTTDEEKVRSFYFWITHNIEYDVNEWVSPTNNWQKQEPANVLKQRKAVCHGYSELFKALCDLSQIKCFLVSGYTKRENVLLNEGHTWNVVYVNNKWLPIDATWGAGGVDHKRKFIKEFEEKYFLPDPVEFLADHYPFDPVWQLVPHPVSLTNYKKQGWKYTIVPNAVVYNYNDTITAWMKHDSSGMRLLSAERMVRLNPNDNESKKEYSYSLMDFAQQESLKGAKILSELYPKTRNQQTTATRRNIPESEFKIKLNDAYMHFSKADSILKKVMIFSQQDRADVENTRKVLKHNMDVIRQQQQQ